MTSLNDLFCTSCGGGETYPASGCISSFHPSNRPRAATPTEQGEPSERMREMIERVGSSKNTGSPMSDGQKKRRNAAIKKLKSEVASLEYQVSLLTRERDTLAGDPMLSRLAHIVTSKTVMECAKLAGHESVFASGWEIPRVEIVEAALREHFGTLLAESRQRVKPMVDAMLEAEGLESSNSTTGEIL